MVMRLAGGDVSRRRLSQIAVNGSAASLAVTNTEGSWDPADAPLLAHREGDTLILNGIAGFVQDARKADFFVASARHGEQVWLCVVDRDADGLRIASDHIHDLTRDQACLHFEQVRIRADAIVTTDGLAALREAWPRLLVLVAADLCGASEWLLQTTVAYACQRIQFDRPIGFFQAVKHPLVNAMLDIDRARSLLYHACAEIDAGSERAEMAARMAKSAASDAAAFVSDRSIQLHGGIGFTWEHALHIYFKRNLHNQALLGDANYQRRKLAEMLIGPIGTVVG
jgi:alkylation response protein AidB-like acyl-CoA dehydrogenase